MRIAVLSDIHSNLPALEAVMKDMERIDQVWVLGDVVGYGPHPNQVIAMLQQVGARTVLGNHDGAAIGTVDAKDFNPDAGRAIAWTGTRIDDNARSYLSSLPEVRTDGDLTAVHGSPRDPIWEYVTSSQIAALNFAAFETRVCFFGHTHLPIVFRLDGDTVRTVQVRPGEPVDLDSKRCLINPGSVGQPRDGDPRAAWLLLDTGSWTAEWRRTEYPIAVAADAIEAAGLPRSLG
ncbi:MAG: metallophosphoesterase, partial [Candidatus Limnocylindria bacterium]